MSDLAKVSSAGSSPRAWGTQLTGTELLFKYRFIPTGVGNSFQTGELVSAATVHPHGRGELAMAADAFTKPYGSSPRAWGTHAAPEIRLGCYRFIPTGVGNS